MSLTIIGKRQTSRSEALSFVKQQSDPIPSIGSVTIRYLAETGVTADANNKVSAWADQSGNNINSSQITASSQPVLGYDSNNNAYVEFGAANSVMNHASVPFTNGTVVLICSLAENVGSGNGKLAYTSVTYNTSWTEYSVLCNFSIDVNYNVVSGGSYYKPLASSAANGMSNTILPTPVSLNAPNHGFMFAARHSPGSHIVDFIGTNKSQLVSNQGDANAGYTSSLGYYTPTDFMLVRYYEYIIFSKLLTDTELTQIENYARSKYGV